MARSRRYQGATRVDGIEGLVFVYSGSPTPSKEPTKREFWAWLLGSRLYIRLLSQGVVVTVLVATVAGSLGVLSGVPGGTAESQIVLLTAVLQYGCFYKLQVLVLGVLVTRALLHRVHNKGPGALLYGVHKRGSGFWKKLAKCP